MTIRDKALAYATSKRTSDSDLKLPAFAPLTKNGRLSLTRKAGESVRLGGDVIMTVVKVHRTSVDIEIGEHTCCVPLQGTVTALVGRVTIDIVSISGGQVRLSFEADRSINIVRTELL